MMMMMVISKGENKNSKMHRSCYLIRKSAKERPNPAKTLLIVAGKPQLGSFNPPFLALSKVSKSEQAMKASLSLSEIPHFLSLPSLSLSRE